MPIAVTECYSVSSATGSRFYCENCFLSLPVAPSAAIVSPSVAVRCCECQLMMGSFTPRTMEELQEATPPIGGVCDACGIPRAVVYVCLQCGNARCPSHRIRCYDCSTELCASCSAMCRCTPRVLRCRPCSSLHALRCSNNRQTEARSGSGRPPPFDFLCDSEDASLVLVKFKRPGKTTPTKKARPTPGVFTAPRRPRAEPEEELDDGDE